MYNEVADDKDDMYKFYLAIVNSNTNNSIGIVTIEPTALSKSSQTTTGSQVDYVSCTPNTKLSICYQPWKSKDFNVQNTR